MFKSFKTFVLLALLSGLILLAGQAIGDRGGLTIALGLALVMNVGSYWFSDKLAIKMARAQEASPQEYPWYHSMVSELALRTGQPMPRLFVSPSPQPNAFATGRNPSHAAVCVNQGLIDLLDRDEMEGVLAHELSHVYNRDILIGTIAATLATAITFLARFSFFFGGGRDREGGPIAQLALLLLAPIAAMLIQFAVTRSRETQADASGAQLSGKPLALASALQKLEAGGKQRMRMGGTPAETSPAFSQLYISAPFGGAVTRGMGSLFRTHPTTESRVANLHEIARGMGQIG
ncbi:MAG: zinc metalloprotease HtpX [Actinomycetota bacterium]|jgi:heat shock protein HtpX|nr:zinc metalloprotease HtpX [Euzebyales bacterium]MDQ3028739.1 zinc metalloprotease HtpX [Actinomycetota bacterium]MDQ3343396.1 zinc metalloprotease HtpX [Actinomycetota bacterium]MDQ3529733.1 zinc metalloprotease HtpX [Actinomycetota bacterium]